MRIRLFVMAAALLGGLAACDRVPSSAAASARASRSGPNGASPGGARDGGASPERSDRGAPADSGRAVFASLERAWAQGDAAGVLAHLGRRSVAISLPGLEPRRGVFSRSQSWFILKQRLLNTQTLQFRFVDTRLAEGSKLVALGLAERQFREPRTGRVTQDRVLVTLVPEGSDWVIASITAL